MLRLNRCAICAVISANIFPNSEKFPQVALELSPIFPGLYHNIPYHMVLIVPYHKWGGLGLVVKKGKVKSYSLQANSVLCFLFFSSRTEGFMDREGGSCMKEVVTKLVI